MKKIFLLKLFLAFILINNIAKGSNDKLNHDNILNKINALSIEIENRYGVKIINGVYETIAHSDHLSFLIEFQKLVKGDKKRYVPFVIHTTSDRELNDKKYLGSYFIYFKSPMGAYNVIYNYPEELSTEGINLKKSTEATIIATIDVLNRLNEMNFIFVTSTIKGSYVLNKKKIKYPSFTSSTFKYSGEYFFTDKEILIKVLPFMEVGKSLQKVNLEGKLISLDNKSLPEWLIKNFLRKANKQIENYKLVIDSLTSLRNDFLNNNLANRDLINKIHFLIEEFDLDSELPKVFLALD